MSRNALESSIVEAAKIIDQKYRVHIDQKQVTAKLPLKRRDA
jgi:hypothetical protein